MMRTSLEAEFFIDNRVTDFAHRINRNVFEARGILTTIWFRCFLEQRDIVSYKDLAYFLGFGPKRAKKIIRAMADSGLAVDNFSENECPNPNFFSPKGILSPELSCASGMCFYRIKGVNERLSVYLNDRKRKRDSKKKQRLTKNVSGDRDGDVAGEVSVGSSSSSSSILFPNGNINTSLREDPNCSLRDQLGVSEAQKESSIGEGEKNKPGKKNPPVPYQKFLDAWNDCSGTLAKAQRLTESRKTKIKLRWKENPDFDYWRKTIERMASSDFCCQGKWANLDWLIANDTNHIKVSEGKYDNQKSSMEAWAEKFLADADEPETGKEKIHETAKIEKLERKNDIGNSPVAGKDLNRSDLMFSRSNEVHKPRVSVKYLYSNKSAG